MRATLNRAVHGVGGADSAGSQHYEHLAPRPRLPPSGLLRTWTDGLQEKRVSQQLCVEDVELHRKVLAEPPSTGLTLPRSRSRPHASLTSKGRQETMIPHRSAPKIPSDYILEPPRLTDIMISPLLCSESWLEANLQRHLLPSSWGMSIHSFSRSKDLRTLTIDILVCYPRIRLGHQLHIEPKQRLLSDCSEQYAEGQTNHQIIFAKINLISILARLRPMQFLGPKEKGWRASRLSFANFGSSLNHLSGINSSGSAKFVGERNTAYWAMPRETYRSSAACLALAPACSRCPGAIRRLYSHPPAV